jgi:AcrR family transcriptional regulator
MDTGNTSGEVAPRRRNAAATREAILRSAKVAFTRHGYDGIGVREIAQGAGVTAMLVNRYFGSKELLFAETVEAVFAEPTLLTDDAATLSRFAAAALAGDEPHEGDHVDGFLLMLRSVSNPRAADILRDSIERHFEQHLSAMLPGVDTHERVALFLSLIAGFELMHDVLGSTAITRTDRPALTRRLEALFQMLVEPDPP